MGRTTFIKIKRTDEDKVEHFGTCPESALSAWEAKGFERVEDESDAAPIEQADPDSVIDTPDKQLPPATDGQDGDADVPHDPAGNGDSPTAGDNAESATKSFGRAGRQR